MNTYQFHLWRCLHKILSSKLSFKAIKMALEKLNIYGLCQYTANNIEIKRTGDGSRDGVDPHHLT